MALASGTIFAVQASATTGNVNGAGFNITNINFPTDLAATVANTSAPVVTSATYTFVSGDVGNWVYVKSGTHWQAGWYKIASVSAGAATLSAAIGAAVLTITIYGQVTYNTVAGCTSDATATLSGGTFGVDYSQTDTANSSITDAVSVGSSVTLTSLTAPWTPVSVGNFFHLTTTGTGAFGLIGWYEIVTYTSAGQVTTDRTTNNGTALASGTGQTGGAGRLNGLEDAFNIMLPSASKVFVKNGTYTFSGSVSTNTTNSTSTNASYYVGYNSIRGDTATGSNRPIFALGANFLTYSQDQMLSNIIITGTSANLLTMGANAVVRNCKITNSSSTTTRVAINTTSNPVYVLDTEIISQNGTGYTSNNFGQQAYGCYIHDSPIGLLCSGASDNITAVSCLIEGCSTVSIRTGGSSGNGIFGNTISGRPTKMGIGIDYTASNAPANLAYNNIITNLTTGIQVAIGTASTNISMNNDFFNNTTDVTNWVKDISDLALDPQFVGCVQITGTTANTSGSVLTDSGANFSTVTDNVDYLHVTSGTGVTTGCYLITSHTTTTLTVNNALGSSSSNNDNYWIITGHNYQIGTNLKGNGFPSFANSGSETVSYPDIGAVQRQESGSSSGNSYTFAG